MLWVVALVERMTVTLHLRAITPVCMAAQAVVATLKPMTLRLPALVFPAKETQVVLP